MAEEENQCNTTNKETQFEGKNGRIEAKILEACQTPKNLPQIANAAGLSYSYCWGKVACLVASGRLEKGNDSDSGKVVYLVVKV